MSDYDDLEVYTHGEYSKSQSPESYDFESFTKLTYKHTPKVYVSNVLNPIKKKKSDT
jgi:hypothetical protein